jgi:hypothetical protein
MKILRMAFVGCCLLATAPAALAQGPTRLPATPLPPSQIGKIIGIDGPPGSVIVVRGAQAYALQPGDALFKGDRVVTRSNGSVTLSANECERRLDPTTTLVVDGDICGTSLVTLDDPNSFIPIAAGGGIASVGAISFILPSFAVAGATAAALTGSASTASEPHNNNPPVN